MSTVMVTNIAPPLIKGISLTREKVIQKMKRPLFYYRGGFNTLCLTLSEHNAVKVYVPLFSRFMSNEVLDIIDANIEKILIKAKELNIGYDTPFLYDVSNDLIVTRASFMDFTPYYNLKGALFINPDNKEFEILHPMDTSDYGMVQFLMVLIAKKDLIIPSNNTWSITGRQLLAFLASHKYKRPISFQWSAGCWNSVDITIEKGEISPLLDMTKLNTTRLDELAEDVLAEVASAHDVVPFWAKYDNVDITLIDVLSAGLDNFFKGSYTGIIEVVIDTMADKYKEVTIDTAAGFCIVTLNPGVIYSDAEVKEDFQSENIQVVQDTLE